MKIPTMNSVFNLAIKIIVIILTLFIIAVLVVGLFHTIWEIKEFIFTKSISQSFNVIVVNILTFLVIIELFRSFVVYFETHRFRLNTMIDPAIVFVVRELIVKLYDEKTWLGKRLLPLDSFCCVWGSSEVLPSNTVPAMKR
jgi:uncharacterized membrane protein (DUF373 family)